MGHIEWLKERVSIGAIQGADARFETENYIPAWSFRKTLEKTWSWLEGETSPMSLMWTKVHINQRTSMIWLLHKGVSNRHVHATSWKLGRNKVGVCNRSVSVWNLLCVSISNQIWSSFISKSQHNLSWITTQTNTYPLPSMVEFSNRYQTRFWISGVELYPWYAACFRNPVANPFLPKWKSSSEHNSPATYFKLRLNPVHMPNCGMIWAASHSACNVNYCLLQK